MRVFFYTMVALGVAGSFILALSAIFVMSMAANTFILLFAGTLLAWILAIACTPFLYKSQSKMLDSDDDE